VARQGTRITDAFTRAIAIVLNNEQTRKEVKRLPLHDDQARRAEAARKAAAEDAKRKARAREEQAKRERELLRESNAKREAALKKRGW
jgi:hypothetical protein